MIQYSDFHHLPQQADEAGNTDLAMKMYFPLADKLITKYFSDYTVEAEAGMRRARSTTSFA